MAAKVNVHRDGATIRITLELRKDSGGSMLEQEESIQDAVNEVGRVATAVSLEGFDTDGSAITVNAVPFTSAAAKKLSDSLRRSRGGKLRLS